MTAGRELLLKILFTIYYFSPSRSVGGGRNCLLNCPTNKNWDQRVEYCAVVKDPGVRVGLFGRLFKVLRHESIHVARGRSGGLVILEKSHRKTQSALNCKSWAKVCGQSSQNFEAVTYSAMY